MPKRISMEATFHWNRLIARHSHHHNPRAALELYNAMRAHSIPPNNHTFPPLLRVCAALRDSFYPLQLHPHLIRLGLLHSHPHTCSSLLSSYGKCGLPHHALHLFDELPHSAIDPVLWTSLISSLAINGLGALALQTFTRMRRFDDGVGGRGGGGVIDVVTLAVLASAAESLSCEFSIHALAVKQGFEGSIWFVNSLVHSYARLGAADVAVRCFDGVPAGDRDVVSWNSLISGLAMNGKSEEAMSVFDEMVDAGIAPNDVTLVSVSKACGERCCVDTARRIHDYIMSQRRPQPDDVVLLTALVDMHAKCGELVLAREVFDGIKNKNVVSWSAMIAGYDQSARPDEALALFREMLREGIMKPNAITVLSVLASCSMIGASRPAGMLHKYAMASGMTVDARVSSSLIDVYAKCGEINLARKVFASIDPTNRTIVSCTAMIGAEGLHGEGQRALKFFREMKEWGIQPNAVTFVSLLSACSHSGLVEEGMLSFKSMEKEYNVVPDVKHYACVVDLLARAGRLSRAHDIICEMPIEADSAVWGCLLAACRVYCDYDLGEMVEKKILEMDPGGAGRHVLLANMYCSAGRLKDVVRMRVELRKKKLVKEAGLSFIEIGNKIYGFVAEDQSHHESELIYKELQVLDVRVQDAGYVKEIPVVATMDRMNADMVGLARSEHHSERLAIAFGILMARRGCLSPSEPIRITKNLRVCRDCHAYTKFVSIVIGKELIVRDAHRFHHFKDGVCSCKDFW